MYYSSYTGGYYQVRRRRSVHSLDVAVFYGNCIEPKSQLPSNETANIDSKWAITRQRVVELFDLVARRILKMKVFLEARF